MKISTRLNVHTWFQLKYKYHSTLTHFVPIMNSAINHPRSRPRQRMNRVQIANSLVSSSVQRKPLTPTQRNQVACRQKWRCAMCESLLDYVFEVDHIVALCNGGKDKMDNLQALCRNCHGKKTYQDIHGSYDDYIEHRHQQQAKQKQHAKPLSQPRWFHPPPPPIPVRKQQQQEEEEEQEVQEVQIIEPAAKTKKKRIRVVLENEQHVRYVSRFFYPPSSSSPSSSSNKSVDEVEIIEPPRHKQRLHDNPMSFVIQW